MLLKSSSLASIKRRAPFAQTPQALMKLEGAIIDARNAGATPFEILSALTAGLSERPVAVPYELTVTPEMSSLCHSLLDETLATAREALAA